MKNQNYRVLVSLYKAIGDFIKVTFGVSAGILVVAPPESFEDFKRTWPAFLISLALALWKALENYRKNSTAGTNPAWHWLPFLKGKVGMLLLSTVLISALIGCAMGRVQQTVILQDGSSVTFEAKGKAVFKALMGENFGDGFVDTYPDGTVNIGANGTQRNLEAMEPEFIEALAEALAKALRYMP